MQQLPASGPLLFSLDSTPWPHPAARALADRQNEYRSALFSAHKALQRLAIIYALATCLDLEGLSRCRHSK